MEQYVGDSTITVWNGYLSYFSKNGSIFKMIENDYSTSQWCCLFPTCHHTRQVSAHFSWTSVGSILSFADAIWFLNVPLESSLIIMNASKNANFITSEINSTWNQHLQLIITLPPSSWFTHGQPTKCKSILNYQQFISLSATVFDCTIKETTLPVCRLLTTSESTADDDGLSEGSEDKDNCSTIISSWRWLCLVYPHLLLPGLWPDLWGHQGLWCVLCWDTTLLWNHGYRNILDHLYCCGYHPCCGWLSHLLFLLFFQLRAHKSLRCVCITVFHNW